MAILNFEGRLARLQEHVGKWQALIVVGRSDGIIQVVRYMSCTDICERVATSLFPAVMSSIRLRQYPTRRQLFIPRLQHIITQRWVWLTFSAPSPLMTSIIDANPVIPRLASRPPRRKMDITHRTLVRWIFPNAVTRVRPSSWL